MRGLQNFTVPIQDNNEFYLEECRGFWSVIRPANKDLTNYIVNPGFEAGVRNFWHSDQVTNNAVLSISQRSVADQDAAHSGNYALKIDQAATGEYGATYQPSNFADPVVGAISIDAGQNMFISLYAKACKGDTINLYGVYDGVQAPTVPDFIQRTTAVTATGNWQRIQTYVTNQRGGATLVGLRITVTPATGSTCTSFLVDDILVTTKKTEFFDGDSEGGSWTGAPYLSTSTIDRFSRLAGEEIRFNDVGFNIISWAGAGMVGVVNDTIPYAQGGGSYYNRSWPSQQRGLTLVGQIENCSGFKQLQKIHSRMIDLISPYRFFTDPQPFLIRYRLVKCDCDNSGVLELPVVYRAGLEGTVNNLWRERISLQLDAYEEQFWSNPVTKYIAITPNTTTTICYNGTAPTPMLFRFIGNTVGANNVDLISVENLTLSRGIYLSSAGLGFQPIPANTIFELGDLDKACASANSISTTNGVVTNNSGNISRPQSIPGQFVLLPGDNDIRINMGNSGATPATVLLAYTERYLSTSDAWRLPVVTDENCGPTFDPLKFLDRC